MLRRAPGAAPSSLPPPPVRMPAPPPPRPAAPVPRPLPPPPQVRLCCLPPVSCISAHLGSPGPGRAGGARTSGSAGADGSACPASALLYLHATAVGAPVRPAIRRLSTPERAGTNQGANGSPCGGSFSRWWDPAHISLRACSIVPMPRGPVSTHCAACPLPVGESAACMDKAELKAHVQVYRRRRGPCRRRCRRGPWRLQARPPPFSSPAVTSPMPRASCPALFSEGGLGLCRHSDSASGQAAHPAPAMQACHQQRRLQGPCRRRGARRRPLWEMSRRCPRPSGRAQTLCWRTATNSWHGIPARPR